MTDDAPATDTDTAANLLAVADKIQFEPETWNQTSYCNPDARRPCFGDDIHDIYAGFVDPPCGTTFCAAGHGAMLLPTKVRLRYDDWDSAGRHALGLTNSGGWRLFSTMALRSHAPRFANVLRLLAKLPEEERDGEAVWRALVEAGLADESGA